MTLLQVGRTVGGKDKEIQIKKILRQRRRFGTLFQRIRTV